MKAIKWAVGHGCSGALNLPTGPELKSAVAGTGFNFRLWAQARNFPQPAARPFREI